MAKVSIVIPVYNVEKYLEQCMESVVRQTLREIEIICVNDGSTDGSAKILEDYRNKDERVLLINQENAGYGKAVNAGMGKASGEYIGIVEPDDFVALDMYEDLYEKAKAYDLDFVKADFYRFKKGKEGNVELYYQHLSPKPEDYRIVFHPNETPEAMKYIMNTWSGIYRRSFLETYHIRHHETPGASFQDNGFWFLTFAYAKRAMILDKPYYMNRRDNPDSSIHSKEKVYCINIEYDYIWETMQKDPERWARFCSMYWLKKYHNYKCTIWRIAPKYRREYVFRFAQEFQRAKQKGELEKNVFSKDSWNNLSLLLKDPGQYYLTRIHPASMNQQVFMKMEELARENQRLKTEIASIRRSKTFRLGKAVLFLPKMVARWASRNQ